MLLVRESGRFVFHPDDAVENSLEHFTRLFFLERKWIAEATQRSVAPLTYRSISTAKVILRGIELKQVKKPWGSFDQYTLNERSTVKILTINPGASTSLQSHKHRREFWVALDKDIVSRLEKKKDCYGKDRTS